MSIGRTYTFLGSNGGVLAPILPIPAGASKARIARARVSMSTVAGGGGESFTIAKGATVIATATMGATEAVSDFLMSATKASADSVITSGTAIATGALTFNIPQLAGNYYVTLDIEWDIDVPDLLPALS